MVALFSRFYGKIWVGFCVNIGNRFFLEDSSYSQQKEHRFFEKTVLAIFKIALRLRNRHVFMSQSVEILNVFKTLTLKQIFWKTETSFKKLKYRFLVESTKIENVSYPYKAAVSETNVKSSRMVSTKWNYHKERSFASNCLFFKILFQFINLFIKNWFDVPTIQMPVFDLFVSAGVLFDSAFW